MNMILGVLYGIPVGQEESVFNRILAGVTYQNTLINLNSAYPQYISNQVATLSMIMAAISRKLTLNWVIPETAVTGLLFPTTGSLQTAFVDGICTSRPWFSELLYL